jgi:hypothetical protein
VITTAGVTLDPLRQALAGRQVTDPLLALAVQLFLAVEQQPPGELVLLTTSISSTTQLERLAGLLAGLPEQLAGQPELAAVYEFIEPVRKAASKDAIDSDWDPFRDQVFQRDAQALFEGGAAGWWKSRRWSS